MGRTWRLAVLGLNGSGLVRHDIGAGGIRTMEAEPWKAYVAKVRDQSYRVSDADVAALIGAGVSEDEVFEL